MASKAEAHEVPKGQWTTGFYGCWDDPSHSKNAACCIYYSLGTPGMKWLFGATYRSKLRRLLSLPQEPYSNSLAHCCCRVCALTQEYKELKNRGIDPSVGWEVNVEKWNREGVQPPIVATVTR